KRNSDQWELIVHYVSRIVEKDLYKTCLFSHAFHYIYCFPTGTKWCGSGNIASNPDDLGKYSETDACCRNHDMCPDVIEAHGTKHGLTNPSFYTRFLFNFVFLFTFT
ncbi:LOW QUALITY PROTEIN: hypothetical protein E2986_11192, partial [Frieseomelitta varia]